MGQKNTIELNGKTYDAATGALLGESRIKATPIKRTGLTSQRGRAIDGFMRKGTQGSAPMVAKPTQTAQKQKATVSHPKKSGASHHLDLRKQTPMPITPHQPERPKTLMRHVVKKPKVEMKPAIKTAAPSEVMARPASTLAKPLEKKLSVTQVNPTRLNRAQQIARSHHIRRYQPTSAPAKHELPSAASAQRQHAHQASRANQYASYAQRPVRSDVQQSAQLSVHTSQTKQSATDIFEAALAHATSHEQPTHPGIPRQSAKQRRFVNIMAGVGAFLLIGGFIGYLNLTNIQLRVASMRAGFHAQLPNYEPSGYTLNGGIESSEGRVAMSFRSGDRSYTVTQEASDWNSATLLDQTASERGEPTQTIQSKGRTIYIYDDSNATWVNGGVRYQISGNAPLDADELVSLATSM